MGVRSKGFKEFGKEIKKLQKRVEEASKPESVSFNILFHEGFMSKYTNFSSIDEFFEQSPFKVETEEDFEALDQTEFDKYVAEHTKFKDWNDMLSTAGQEHVAKKLGF
jgi:hypothetical protein